MLGLLEACTKKTLPLPVLFVDCLLKCHRAYSHSTLLPPLSYFHVFMPSLIFMSLPFHLPSPFILPLLVFLQQISCCFFHLFTHCCLEGLRNCYIMHLKLSQCMYYGYNQIQRASWELMSHKGMECPIAHLAD